MTPGRVALDADSLDIAQCPAERIVMRGALNGCLASQCR
jgi:hypothetical protein